MRASTKKLIRDYSLTIAGAAGFALMIRIFLIEAYRIPTPAMRPTLEAGDTVFVAKRPWGLRLFAESDFHRGDVILFRPADGSARDYIKRIVAMPGETVQMTQGILSINGALLAHRMEAHGPCGTETFQDGFSGSICSEPPLPRDFGPVKVPEDSVFVLGDFRTDSQIEPALKGKSWGMIPKDWFRGKALWVWLSVEPPSPSEEGVSSGRFPRVRFERMFRRIQ